MMPTIPYDAIVARARRCLAIARDRAAVADHERAAKFSRYAEALVDLLEIDLRARGESWDVPGRETLEGRLRRIEGALRGPVVAEEETGRVNVSETDRSHAPSRRLARRTR